jgi:hypothetical protein
MRDSYRDRGGALPRIALTRPLPLLFTKFLGVMLCLLNGEP